LDGENRVGTSTNPDAACFKGGNEMKKQSFAIAAAFLISTAVLCILLGILGEPGSGIEAVLAAPPDAPSSRASNRAPITKSVGISYDLHGFDAPYNADWGSWCETDTISSTAACADYGLLSSSFVTTETHREGSTVSLKLSYTVTQTNTRASYFEHLSIGDVYYDLSRLSEFRFWVKGEGNTIGDDTTFWIRFADKDWHMGFYTITVVSGDWQEEPIPLESLRKDPDWQDVNWRQMREITIIFENDRDGSGRVANPLTGTLYFDLIGLTSPDSDPTFPDSLNNFIADWGYWCETEITGSNAACVDYGLLSSNVVTTPHHGGSGASLKLSYTVTQANTLASHYEHLYNSDTFYDLSSMGEFRFWVKGEGDTIGGNTTFWVRFADKEWHTGFYTITGVSGDWQEKTIDLEPLKNAPGWENINWHQMREVTIIFENDRDGSGRVANPLAGTLYFDDLAFVDVETDVDTDDQFLELLERRAFQYFWEYADPATGLIRETAAEPDMSSIATVGFGLTSICAAKERGWITREAAYTRVLTTLNSFYDDPSDPTDLVVSGTHGLFYHFVNMHDGTPMLADLDGVSTIDTALLMGGVLSVKQCFTETEIITRATAIYEAADWKWFLDEEKSGLLTMCWTPQDKHPYQCWTTPEQRGDGRVWRWAGYNEAMILYLLAIGSPTHPISAASWNSWASSYRWGAYYGYPVLVHGPSPLFAHQYSHAWVDFEGKRDDYANYFRTSVYATLANRAYCRDVWYPYRDLWGITTSHGPIAGTCSGKTYRMGIGYPPDHGNNDGTIAPTAAGGSIVFAPHEAISTLRYMVDHYHQRLWGLYGLKDSLNAWCEPDWFDNDYMGIDVGAMLLMIENYRSNLVWNIFMRNPEIVEAMNDVGFLPDPTIEPSFFYYREAEKYDWVTGTGISVEPYSKAWNQHTLQISQVVGNSASYVVPVDCDGGCNAFFQARYSDTVPGDVIDVYLDGTRKGNFNTDDSGNWNGFIWDDEIIDLGGITSGAHTITLRVAEGGGGPSGVNLDVFRLYTYHTYLPLVLKNYSC
jgi:hypothetical protein